MHNHKALPGIPSQSRPSTPTAARVLPSGRLLKRAFFCDVVLEGGRESDETNLFLSTLGDQLHAIPYPAVPSVPLPTSSASSLAVPGRMLRSSSVDVMSTSPSLPNLTKLPPLLSELLSTEQTYVRRLHALKNTYADPLRLFSKDPSMAIIPVYNASQLFGNIDVIVKVNEAFLADLERVLGSEAEEQVGAEWGVGDVALKHFKELRAFDCYKTYYDKCEDAQTMFADMIVRRKQFADFVSASKYKTEGVSNVGLRELLMEPVQRIPRYTMIWQLMIKHMPLSDPQRQKLMEATEIATEIATCEKDPHTKRMLVMMALSKSVDGFPAELINNNRDYLASIDVEDLPPTLNPPAFSPATQPSHPPAHLPTLHCTLYLFSDRILIGKRPSAGASGRKLTGLDDVARLWKGSVGPSSVPSVARKSEGEGRMGCKGLVGLLDLVVCDSGGGDFSVYLPFPPVDQSDRWSNRPFRSYTVVHPPLPLSIDPQAASTDRHRFVQNVWAAQALIRARGGRSLAFKGREDERLVPVEGSVGESAKGFWNVWRRLEWESDQSKCKVVVQVDESGTSKPLLMDEGRSPALYFKVQPLIGGLTRLVLKTPSSDATEEIIPTTSVVSNILQQVYHHGLYQPRVDTRSAPNTPSSHVASRRPVLGLDALSRNLFGSGSSVSSKGSVTHKRSRSNTSKSSTINSSTTRSTMSSFTTYSDLPPSTEKSPTSRSGSTSPFSFRKPVPNEDFNGSEEELTGRLELARKNGQNMVQLDSQKPLEQPKELNEERAEPDRQALERASTRTSTRPKPPTTPSFASNSPLVVRNKTPPLIARPTFEPLTFEPSPANMGLMSPVDRAPSPPLDRSPSESRRPMGPRRPISTAKSAVQPEEDESPSPTTALKRDRAKSMENLSPSSDKKPRHVDERSPRSRFSRPTASPGPSTRNNSVTSIMTSVPSQTAQLLKELEELRSKYEGALGLVERQSLELSDVKNENATLYDAFNEELEQMYADMNLPGAESNIAMKRDLQMAKADRNALRLENAALKRELEHITSEKNRQDKLLKQHGLFLP